MPTVLGRLLDIESMPAPRKNNLSKEWDFTAGIEKLTKNKNDKHSKLVGYFLADHKLIGIEYQSLCRTLYYDYTAKQRNSSSQNKKRQKRTEEQLVGALMLAEIQEIMYVNIHAPTQVEKFRKDQKIFRQLLRERGYRFQAPKKNKAKPTINFFNGITTAIRNEHAFFNGPKLMILRGKRIVSLFLQEFESITAMIDKPFLVPLNYFSWLFFMPRFFTNWILFGKHLIGGPWMKDAEKRLGVLRRLWIQVQRRGAELANDTAWALNGFLVCFFFVGPLAPMGAYITVLFFAYDVLVAVIRGGIEIERLRGLKNHYLEIIDARRNAGEPLDDALHFLAELTEQIDNETEKLELAIYSTILLLAAVVLGLPAVAVSPTLSLISAILVFTITVGTYILNREFEKKIPQIQLKDLIENELEESLGEDFIMNNAMLTR